MLERSLTSRVILLLLLELLPIQAFVLSRVRATTRPLQQNTLVGAPRVGWPSHQSPAFLLARGDRFEDEFGADDEEDDDDDDDDEDDDS